MIIALLCIVILVAALGIMKILGELCKSLNAATRQLDRIVDHLNLIKRSIDFQGEEIMGPLVSEIKTVLDQRLRLR